MFGVIIGIPVLRLRGDYLAIVTLAFGEIIKNLINILYVGFDENGLHVATSSANLKLAAGGKQILKGALGISGTGALYKDVKHYFFPIGIILVLLTLFIVQNLVNSRSGRAIMATRDNRIAAESVGIDVTKFKLLAFTISAALAGVAGVLYAHNLSMLKKLKRFYDRNDHSLCTSGTSPWICKLPYADLCDCPDRYDAL